MREGGDDGGSEVHERRGLIAIRISEPGSLGSVRGKGGSKSSNLEEMRKGRGRGDRTGLACHENGQDKDDVMIEGEECTAVPSENGYDKLRGNVDGRDARIEEKDNLKVTVNFREDDGGDLKMNSSGLEKEEEQDNDGSDNDCQTPVLGTQLPWIKTSSSSTNQFGDVGGGKGRGCLQTSLPDEVPTTPRDDSVGVGSPQLPPDFRNQKARHEMYKKRGGEGRRLSWRRKRQGLDPRRDLNVILQNADGEFKSLPDDINIGRNSEIVREESEEP